MPPWARSRTLSQLIIAFLHTCCRVLRPDSPGMQVGATSWPLEKTSPTLKSGEYAYVFAVDGGTAFYSVLLSTGVCFPSPGTSFCLPMHVCLLASLSPTQKALSHIHACMSPHGRPAALRIAPHAMPHETCICPVGYFQSCTVALTPTIHLSCTLRQS